jgi:glutamate mutase epsilon subunit
MRLTNDQKAKIYDQMIFRYQRISEQIRQLKAKNFEVSESDQRTINALEVEMKRIYSESQKLFID